MANIELLAPAGNLDSLKMAIFNGANAVYLGLDDFNARGNIENFNRENLAQCVDFAHLFGVKIYLTINTLIKDEEVDDFLNLVKFALESNVDAFIIQDIGMAYLLRLTFPSIVLHASTQMGVQTLEGVQFLERLGFSRVVLARETSLKEIRRIKENTPIEIEYFVHGALCVAFSGNCYLCSLLAGASGNRGKCKQFCRLKYSLQTENLQKEGYLLSTKDFCMLPSLKELCDAGVTSLKIEGRARRASYVGEIVRLYRYSLDHQFTLEDQAIENAKKVFNRGNFVQGYFKDEKIIYDKCQNHIGEYIGKVIKCNSGRKFNEIFIQSSQKINRGDALKFFDNEKECGSIVANDVQKVGDKLYKITSTFLPKKLWQVNRIVDIEFEKEILDRKRKLPVMVEFIARANHHLKVKLECGDSKIELKSDFVLEPAQNQPITREDVKNCFEKCGEIFYIKSIKTYMDDIFIAKSKLNEFRRQAFSQLQNEILKCYQLENDLEKHKIQKNEKISLKNQKNASKKMILSQNLEKLAKNADENTILVYDFNRLSFEELENFCRENKLYLFLPVISTEEDLCVIKSFLERIENLGIVASNYSHLSLTSSDRIIIGNNMNVYNSYSVKFYKENNFENIILSIEDNELAKIFNSGARLFAFSSYYPNFMYFKHCPFKEHIGGDCKNCRYKEGISYSLNQYNFDLKRKKISSCQFVLKSKQKFDKSLPDNISEIIEI